MNGKQGGDPAKLAAAVVQLAGRDETPLRWPAGADAVGALEQKHAGLNEACAAVTAVATPFCRGHRQRAVQAITRAVREQKLSRGGAVRRAGTVPRRRPWPATV